jgi:transketolase
MDSRSKYLRSLAIDALEGGQRGHIGSTFSLIEIFRVLYDDIIFFDKTNPLHPLRDRVILSKGHGCIAQYVLLADKGFFPQHLLKTFCKFDSILGGHPERGHIPGIETSTGSLGHGPAIGVGIAVANKIKESNKQVFVVVGDGEINEGSVWESALAASHHKLDNFTIIVDYNKIQSFGLVSEVLALEPLLDKFISFGFDTKEVDGHNVEELKTTLTSKPVKSKPRAIIAHTIKGKGISFAENNPGWHHKSNLGVEDIKNLRDAVQNA